jgi:flagellar hook-basal body complex protein FliE
MSVAAISALLSDSIDPSQLDPSGAGGAARARPTQSFSQMLLDGVNKIDKEAKSADAMVTAFALDDSIPPHEVMFAVEQAHHAFEVVMQVRSRMVEGYQELMRMQL